MPFAVPSFELLPGAEGSPVILHVPHSAREIPPEVRAGILLDDRALERELDHIVDAITSSTRTPRNSPRRPPGPPSSPRGGS